MATKKKATPKTTTTTTSKTKQKPVKPIARKELSKDGKEVITKTRNEKERLTNTPKIEKTKTETKEKIKKITVDYVAFAQIGIDQKLHDKLHKEVLSDVEGDNIDIIVSSADIRTPAKHPKDKDLSLLYERTMVSLRPSFSGDVIFFAVKSELAR